MEARGLVCVDCHRTSNRQTQFVLQVLAYLIELAVIVWSAAPQEGLLLLFISRLILFSPSVSLATGLDREKRQREYELSNSHDRCEGKGRKGKGKRKRQRRVIPCLGLEKEEERDGDGKRDLSIPG